MSSNNDLAFQDVRFFDRALSAEEVRLYANAFPPPVSEDRSSSLLHRWSFNGDLHDTGSLGGNDATLQGSEKGNITYINDDTEIKLTDGTVGKDRSWIQLGSNIIPASLGDTPFTIEQWTTLRSRDGYRPCFGFGVDGCNGSKVGLHFAYHNGSVPIFNPAAAQASGVWNTGGNIVIGTSAFPLNEKCHVAFAVVSDGTGNATISAYIHKADGTLVGSCVWPSGLWMTSKIVQNAFMLGRSFWNNENPQSSYDEVRVGKIALTKEQIEESISLGPDTLPGYSGGTIRLVQRQNHRGGQCGDQFSLH